MFTLATTDAHAPGAGESGESLGAGSFEVIERGAGHLIVEVALRPEVEVRFYELAGVTVGVEAYGAVDVELSPLTCDFSAGLRGDVAADLGAFGVGVMWERDLFDEPIADRACF